MALISYWRFYHKNKLMIITITVLVLFTIALAAMFIINRRLVRKMHEFINKKIDSPKYDILSLPDLNNHRFFNEATRQMRIAESVTNPLERNLIIWTIRCYRNVFIGIVEVAYKNRFSTTDDSAKFRANIDTALVESTATIRRRLVDDFNFPSAIYFKWQKFKEPYDDLMVSLLDIASERSTTYDRLQSTLDFQYVRILMIRKMITDFIAAEVSVSELSLYRPPLEASVGTDVPTGLVKAISKPTEQDNLDNCKIDFKN